MKLYASIVLSLLCCLRCGNCEDIDIEMDLSLVNNELYGQELVTQMQDLTSMVCLQYQRILIPFRKRVCVCVCDFSFDKPLLPSIYCLRLN